jgi:hypothetical protein
MLLDVILCELLYEDGGRSKEERAVFICKYLEATEFASQGSFVGME